MKWLKRCKKICVINERLDCIYVNAVGLVFPLVFRKAYAHTRAYSDDAGKMGSGATNVAKWPTACANYVANCTPKRFMAVDGSSTLLYRGQTKKRRQWTIIMPGYKF